MERCILEFNICKCLRFFFIKNRLGWLFSCPGQLNSWPFHWLIPLLILASSITTMTVTHVKITDKLRNLNHDIEHWIAFAILAMFQWKQVVVPLLRALGYIIQKIENFEIMLFWRYVLAIIQSKYYVQVFVKFFKN